MDYFLLGGDELDEAKLKTLMAHLLRQSYEKSSWHIFIERKSDQRGQVARLWTQTPSALSKGVGGCGAESLAMIYRDAELCEQFTRSNQNSNIMHIPTAYKHVRQHGQ
mmetsp:Transcript_7187/g.23029  ORF Transcript_7187/g.23029 Transcript_7187/m.23029 type:complete len:108 (+) Transcript_7187:302-625(+)